MHTYDVVLFLHIFVVICAIGLASAIHGCELLMRRATTVAEMRTLAKPGDFGPAFAVIVLLLFGLGSWLVHLSPTEDKFKFGNPFIWTAIVVLVYLFASGPSVLARHHGRLRAALDALPEGPLPPEVRELGLDRFAVTVGFTNTFLAVGVVFNMATKPSVATCVVVLAVALAVGVALGRLATRPVGARVLSTQAAPQEG